MAKAQNKFMVQIVWGNGGRCKQESLPNAFPATLDGYAAMRASLMECIERIDKVVAREPWWPNDAAIPDKDGEP